MKPIRDYVSRSTRISQTYADHAAPESIEAYLTDWISAKALLEQRIVELQLLRRVRAAEKADGSWPRPKVDR
jgi:hypothetical protein